jgi:Ssp1 endopeptidase immunity protein Rap1a
MKFFFAAGFILLVSASAHAQRVSTTTGNELLESCEAKGSFKEAFCLGYITGVTDLDQMNASVFPEHRRSCVPENVTNGQIRDVIVRYLTDHPEERHMLAAILVAEAMGKAFPCKA